VAGGCGARLVAGAVAAALRFATRAGGGSCCANVVDRLRRAWEYGLGVLGDGDIGAG